MPRSILSVDWRVQPICNARITVVIAVVIAVVTACQANLEYLLRVLCALQSQIGLTRHLSYESYLTSSFTKHTRQQHAQISYALLIDHTVAQCCQYYR